MRQFLAPSEAASEIKVEVTTRLVALRVGLGYSTHQSISTVRGIDRFSHTSLALTQEFVGL